MCNSIYFLVLNYLTLASRRYNNSFLYDFIFIHRHSTKIHISMCFEKNSCSEKFRKPSSKTSTVESFLSILKGLLRNFNHSQETFAVESISSTVIGGSLDSSNWLKGTPKKTFFWKFPETTAFSKHPPKNV